MDFARLGGILGGDPTPLGFRNKPFTEDNLRRNILIINAHLV